MAFCAKCGKELNEGDKVCSSCGEPVGVVRGEASNDSNDKLMGILAYIGILALIPYFIKDQSRFVRFHAVSGINLLILEAILYFAVLIVTIVTFGLGAVLGWIAFALCLAFSILGIINVVNGEQKELPFIGSIRFVKE